MKKKTVVYLLLAGCMICSAGRKEAAGAELLTDGTYGLCLAADDELDRHGDEVEKADDAMGRRDDEMEKADDMVDRSVDEVEKADDAVGSCGDEVEKTDDEVYRCGDEVEKIDDGVGRRGDDVEDGENLTAGGCDGAEQEESDADRESIRLEPEDRGERWETIPADEEWTMISVPAKTGSIKAAALWRLFNPYTGEHFFTMNEEEKAALCAKGWRGEGIAWISFPGEGKPVYRLYNPEKGFEEHLYTMDREEIRVLTLQGWMTEGIAFSSDEEGDAVIYRLFHPGALHSAASHLYTTDVCERNELKRRGWRDEGGVFRGYGKSGRISESAFLEKRMVSLLINKNGVRDSFSLYEDEEAAEDPLISCEIRDPSMGVAEGNRYRAVKPGRNQVLVSFASGHQILYIVCAYCWEAHRGYMDKWPENSAGAFEAAGRCGAYSAECDVGISSDGVPVIMHDRTVDCMTSCSGKLSDYTFAELSGMTLTNGNGLESCENPGICSLDEYLEICKRYQMIASIELKYPETYGLCIKMVKETVAKIRAHDMEGQCYISSFSPSCIRLVREENRDIPLVAFRSYPPVAVFADQLEGCYGSRQEIPGFGPVTLDEKPPMDERAGMNWEEYHRFCRETGGEKDPKEEAAAIADLSACGSL